MIGMRERNIYKKSAADAFRGVVVPIIFTLAVVGMIAFGLRQAEISSKAESLRVLEEGILRAAVKCYAVEGRYPDTIGYIERHYGIHIDRSKYAVYYEIVATNLFPNITVVELQSDR
jgi:hypothetical protein